MYWTSSWGLWDLFKIRESKLCGDTKGSNIPGRFTNSMKTEGWTWMKWMINKLFDLKVRASGSRGPMPVIGSRQFQLEIGRARNYKDMMPMPSLRAHGSHGPTTHVLSKGNFWIWMCMWALTQRGNNSWMMCVCEGHWSREWFSTQFEIELFWRNTYWWKSFCFKVPTFLEPIILGLPFEKLCQEWVSNGIRMN